MATLQIDDPYATRNETKALLLDDGVSPDWGLHKVCANVFLSFRPSIRSTHEITNPSTMEENLKGLQYQKLKSTGEKISTFMKIQIKAHIPERGRAVFFVLRSITISSNPLKYEDLLIMDRLAWQYNLAPWMAGVVTAAGVFDLKLITVWEGAQRF